MKLSIISVTYNNLVGLLQTYESISKQKFLDEIEWIVIDGNSKDGTREFLKANSLVKHWVSEPDKGIYDAQNKGILRATGKWFYFLNAGDTFYNPKVIENLQYYFDSNYALLYGGIAIKDQEGKKFFSDYPADLRKRFWSRDGQFLCHQAIFYRKEIFSEFGIYNTRYRFAADFEHLMRFWSSEDIIKKNIRVYVVNYALDGVSADKKNESKVLKEYSDIIYRYFPFFDFLTFQTYRFKTFSKFFKFIRKLRIKLIHLDLKAYLRRLVTRVIFHWDVSKRSRILFEGSFQKLYKTKPRVLHFSYNDSKGGAARSATSIHHALMNSDFDSFMAVKEKTISDNSVFVTPLKKNDFEKIVQAEKKREKQNDLYVKGKFGVLFSEQIYSYCDLEYLIKEIEPDVIHLHWIGQNFLSIEDIGKIKLPIVWTLHDMWPFCGGSHVDLSDDYKLGYENDPEEFRVWKRKSESWSQLDLHPVGVSEWMAKEAKSSLLFQSLAVVKISNLVDTEKFKPMDKEESRILLGLPLNPKIILFGSDYRDRNKNLSLTTQIMNQLKMENIYFVSFGDAIAESDNKNYYHFGYVSDDQVLRELYSASDLFVVPSKIESFCYVAAESIACGTPVVSFDTSGLKDIVINGVTGYRAKCYDPDHFSGLVEKVITNRSDSFHPEELHAFILNHFSKEKIRASYLDLYKSVIN
jgi:glycosyltransferase involved in cell wall biosynthesis